MTDSRQTRPGGPPAVQGRVPAGRWSRSTTGSGPSPERRLRGRAGAEEPGPSVSDPRVSDPVGDVGDQVEEHGPGGHQHDYAEDDWIVSIDYRLEGQLPGARPAENAFGDDGAVDDLWNRDRHQCDDRQDGVTQGVLVIDFLDGQALRAGRPDVVLMEHLQHAGPHEAAEDRNLQDSEGGHRENHVVEEVDRISDAAGVHAKQRETPMEGRLFQERPEDDQEIEAQHEARNGYADIREKRGGHVRLGVLVGSRKDPERDPDG